MLDYLKFWNMHVKTAHGLMGKLEAYIHVHGFRWQSP